ncbi:TIGR03759 family integrating conjugative element protein [Pseudomonas sp. B15(2017)]|uniref:TIGR03759 family integrating conjugative element protein n=1 Tax=Pseudomonas sp. B15(2017) TaxID=1981744 RepID=UPI000A1EA05E|nr:TIGR03759 family integrating conjugative element protein [Pseudomonas sp. B15(2017)]
MVYMKLLPYLLWPVYFAAQAQEPVKQVCVEANSQLRSVTTKEEMNSALAQQWGLKLEELQRFRDLMQGPLGTYSPNLDPLSALGIEASTDAERQRYALLQVQAEATRVEKLLAYQRAYDQAWKQRYPELALVNLSPIASPLMSKSKTRQAVFVQYDCPECETTVRQLQASGTPFDLYVVNSHQDDNRIRQWAQKAGIHPSNVRDGIISINHDNGRWSSTATKGPLPAIMRKVNGKWVRQ